MSDFDAEDYVLLTEEDLSQLTWAEIERMVYTEREFGKPMCSMKTRTDRRGNCRCIALEGIVGEQVSCSIYDRRPKVCHKFDPGTDVCDYARQIAFGVSNK